MSNIIGLLDRTPSLNNHTFGENLLYNLNTDDVETKEIDPQLAYQYKGDFNSLLRDMNVPKEVIYLTCLLNGIERPTMFDGKLTYIHRIKPEKVLDYVTASIEWKNYLDRSMKKEEEMKNYTHM